MDRGGWILGSVLGLTVVVSAWAMRGREPTRESFPKREPQGEWVSSSACKSCHPGEHASWHRSYHRTMTQVATPETVLAPNVDPAVILTTGSHHEQTYWVKNEKGELRLWPFVWLKREKKLIPREDAFLRPPDAPMPNVRWNSNCIQCHATGGRPELHGDHFETDVVELGIACEACHGPGGEHVEKHRDPIERWVARSDGKRDASIVNPGKLDPKKSAAVCGQCHSYSYPRDEDEWWTSGYTKAFRPGQSFEGARILLSPGSKEASIEAADDSLWWRDGTIRVGGREYNAMVLSKCFTNGDLTCTSCHAMHAGDPDDQLAPEKLGDAMCTQCHKNENHSHHAPGSTGSRCVECHMPMTSYALFTAIRSHRIDNPKIGERLPACNLCHLDRTLAWTDARLAEWYGAKRENPSGELPAIVTWALRGDAAERALAAAAMGRKEALDASGRDWEKPVLEALRADPYAAVRFIAERSVREVTGIRTLLSQDAIRTEIARRDDRPVTIAE